MPHRRHPWLQRLAWLRRNRCSLLLASLCAMIVANPMFGDTVLGPKALRISLLVILVVASWALRMPRKTMLAVATLAIVVAVMIVGVPGDSHWMRPIANGGMAFFIGVITVELLLYVLDPHLINTDKVFGAVAAYVLIAISFACLFCAMQYVQDKAFHINEVNDLDGKLSWSDAMYFS